MNKPKTKTDFKYWYAVTEYTDIIQKAKLWFGKRLTRSEGAFVVEMLKTYPAPDQSEAIETVLLIYFANTK